MRIRETDLYGPVREYLEAQGYRCREVNRCDLTAIEGDELIVVEMKTSFNLKLLCQAVKRQRSLNPYMWPCRTRKAESGLPHGGTCASCCAG